MSDEQVDNGSQDPRILAMNEARQRKIDAGENTPISKSATQRVRAMDGGTVEITYSRKDAIRMWCTECMGWEGDPKECGCILCPLYP